jgi:hypothetical protein
MTSLWRVSGSAVGRLVTFGLFVIAAYLVVAELQPDWAGAAAPTVTLSSTSNLHSGQTVAVSVGPNTFFSPNARVNMLECADPGGTVANLPKDDSTCDGNTIQADTVLVGSNGSVSESGYTMYALPSATLGEQSNIQPVCNLTNPCVLFVGENQNDFTAPKIFSAPFTIAPASSTVITPTTVPSSTATQDQGGANASAPSPSTPAPGSAGSSQLPNTGAPGGIVSMTVVGASLLVIGSLGRRFALRVSS